MGVIKQLCRCLESRTAEKLSICVQPQGHVQVVTNMIDFHLNPQQTLDTPRWMKEKDIEVEENFPKDIFENLKKKGHNISVSKNVNSFGRREIIVK